MEISRFLNWKDYGLNPFKTATAAQWPRDVVQLKGIQPIKASNQEAFKALKYLLCTAYSPE